VLNTGGLAQNMGVHQTCTSNSDSLYFSNRWQYSAVVAGVTVRAAPLRFSSTSLPSRVVTVNLRPTATPASSGSHARRKELMACCSAHEDINKGS
jgi:hypothetical protein